MQNDDFNYYGYYSGIIHHNRTIEVLCVCLHASNYVMSPSVRLGRILHLCIMLELPVSKSPQFTISQILRHCKYVCMFSWPLSQNLVFSVTDDRQTYSNNSSYQMLNNCNSSLSFYAPSTALLECTMWSLILFCIRKQINQHLFYRNV